MPVFTIRRLAERGELLEILNIAFGNLYNQTDTRLALFSPRFDPVDCFIAEQAGSVIGSVAVYFTPPETLVCNQISGRSR